TETGCSGGGDGASTQASMGPSRVRDGDRTLLPDRALPTHASMGPSRVRDGDLQSTLHMHPDLGASMGPSRVRDGDVSVEIFTGLREPLQWGRRVFATETAAR